MRVIELLLEVLHQAIEEPLGQLPLLKRSSHQAARAGRLTPLTVAEEPPIEH